MRAASAVILLALALASCSQEPDTPTAASVCAGKLYSPFNPKDLKQCVDVCIKCDRGSTTTCTTSCTLKGAR